MSNVHVTLIQIEFLIIHTLGIMPRPSLVWFLFFPTVFKADLSYARNLSASLLSGMFRTCILS